MIDNEDDDNERRLVQLFDLHNDINGGNKMKQIRRHIQLIKMLVLV